MNSQAYYTPGYNMGAAAGVGGAGGAGVNDLFADPMASAAMMYGSSLDNQGKDMVNEEVRNWCHSGPVLIPDGRWSCGLSR